MTPSERVFGPAAIAKISLWSYSLYLVNLPVRAVVALFLSGSVFRVAPLAYLAFSIALAALIYAFYERPMMDSHDRLAIRRIELPAVPSLLKTSR